ncbi:hypothetical protein MMPV_008534 [Pyropia vietnamensis]
MRGDGAAGGGGSGDGSGGDGSGGGAPAVSSPPLLLPSVGPWLSALVSALDLADAQLALAVAYIDASQVAGRARITAGTVRGMVASGVLLACKWLGGEEVWGVTRVAAAVLLADAMEAAAVRQETEVVTTSAEAASEAAAEQLATEGAEVTGSAPPREAGDGVAVATAAGVVGVAAAVAGVCEERPPSHDAVVTAPGAGAPSPASAAAATESEDEAAWCGAVRNALAAEVAVLRSREVGLCVALEWRLFVADARLQALFRSLMEWS